MTDEKDNRSERTSRAGLRTVGPLSALLVAAFALTGCAGLQPIEAIAGGEPAGRHLVLDGIRIWIEEHGRGEPVILVHGFGGSTYSWRKIVPELSREARVIAVDLLGFGLSERSGDPARYSRAQQVDLLTRLLDQLDIERAHWVGHSYGGGLVTTLAFRYPERSRSLTLIASTAPDWADRRRGLLGRRIFAAPFVRAVALKPRFVRRSLQRSFFDDTLVDDALVSAYLERLRVEGAVDAFVGLTAPHVGPDALGDVDLGAIEVPTLVLWGREDSLTSIEGAFRATEGIPDARLVAIAECGHIPMEEKPGIVSLAILDFLEEIRHQKATGDGKSNSSASRM